MKVHFSRRSIMAALGVSAATPAVAAVPLAPVSLAAPAERLEDVIAEFVAVCEAERIIPVSNGHGAMLTYVAPQNGFGRTALRQMAAFEERLDRIDGGIAAWADFHHRREEKRAADQREREREEYKRHLAEWKAKQPVKPKRPRKRRVVKSQPSTETLS